MELNLTIYLGARPSRTTNYVNADSVITAETERRRKSCTGSVWCDQKIATLGFSVLFSRMSAAVIADCLTLSQSPCNLSLLHWRSDCTDTYDC